MSNQQCRTRVTNMTSHLSSAQRERAGELLARARNRTQMRLDNYEDGGVERELSSFFNGIAGEYQRIGVLEVAVGDLSASREAFESSTTYYQRSAEKDVFPVQSSRQLMQGMYTGLVAGSDETVQLADSMLSLADTEDCSPGEHNADRYFLSWCLAGAICADVSVEGLTGLETVNESKPVPHADYGQAMLSIARGIRNADQATLQAGIETMLAFHEQDSHSDNVVDQAMSVQATALLVLVQSRGYDISVDSLYIPIRLVEQAVERIRL